MARNKEEKKKKFLIAARKKIGPGLTNAPVWVMQKSQTRIWNKRQKRHWRQTNLGMTYTRAMKDEQGEHKK